MIQILMIGCSIGLIILGIKGFTPSGLAFSKTTTLRGTSGKIVGTACIIGGIALIPLFFVIVWAFSR